ncbi:MAG: DNA polymerase III subunit delta' [Planctomycetes bacterium]|nr:DNA polymerase III subunit delta' [Planctomycetota bacterium]
MNSVESGPAFDRIVGHRHPKAFLDRIQATGRIATGLLFHGDRGRGKHTTARAFVQRLFCDQADGCGRCPPCRQLLSHNHPDLESVGLAEGKSRIAIEQIRDLKEWFSRAPFEADRRVAIVDDAQLMSTEAQNSLLKLLEEPPGAGLLILVTPEPGGLLETVHSRLQSVYFGPLADQDILEILAAQGEVEPEAARAVLPLAGGSVGRALENLGDERSQVIIEAATRLFDLALQPFAYAEFVCGGKTAGAAARRDVGAVLDAAMEMLSRKLRAEALGLAPAAASSGSLPPLPLEVIEEVQGLLLEAQASVGANVSPRGLLESLKIRLHRLIGLARRRTVGGEG